MFQFIDQFFIISFKWVSEVGLYRPSDICMYEYVYYRMYVYSIYICMYVYSNIYMYVCMYTSIYMYDMY